MIDLKINRKIKLSRLTTKRQKKSSTFFALETSVSVNSTKNLSLLCINLFMTAIQRPNTQNLI